MAKVKIRQTGPNIVGATIEVDGQSVPRVKGVTLQMSPEKNTVAIIKRAGPSDVEVEADVDYTLICPCCGHPCGPAWQKDHARRPEIATWRDHQSGRNIKAPYRQKSSQTRADHTNHGTAEK